MYPTFTLTKLLASVERHGNVEVAVYFGMGSWVA
jgi:hypothetical protein